MEPFQSKLVHAWEQYAQGYIDGKELKSVSAGFGIYLQRDGNAMMRIRRPGGVVTLRDLRNVAEIIYRLGLPFCHLTSRLDIQLHGVPPRSVPFVLELCESRGMPFRGGGGDTFRNVQVSASSGLHGDSAFDVIPYARALSSAFYRFDTAYALPRKIKIGFADRAADRRLAAVQDLGFVAKMQDGRRVFETWVAGGIGFRSSVGVKIFDALPAEDCCRLAFALTRMFDEKGNRTNRAHARIRFLREDMGDDAFVSMLKEYFGRETAAGPVDGKTVEPEEWPDPSFAADAEVDGGFDVWRQLATAPLRNGRFAVRLFVPYSRLDYGQICKLCEAFEPCGVQKMQLLASGDLCIQNVPENQLAALHGLLKRRFHPLDCVVGRSFAGHILTCIGGSVCTTGVNDAPAFATDVARELDRRIMPIDTPEKLKIAKLILNDVRISGCPNCCTNNPLARFGFICRKSGDEPALMPIVGAKSDPVQLGELQRETIACSDVPDWILRQM